MGRYPDYSVRAGDFYLVKTDVGIVVLLRESERSDYLELPATVATAWLAMMKTRGWLWPKAPLVEPSGRLRYPIWSDETPETKVGVISYDPRTREAVHAGIPYRTETIREIGLAELIYEAKKA